MRTGLRSLKNSSIILKHDTNPGAGKMGVVAVTIRETCALKSSSIHLLKKACWLVKGKTLMFDEEWYAVKSVFHRLTWATDVSYAYSLGFKSDTGFATVVGAGAAAAGSWTLGWCPWIKVSTRWINALVAASQVAHSRICSSAFACPSLRSHWACWDNISVYFSTLARQRCISFSVVMQ